MVRNRLLNSDAKKRMKRIGKREKLKTKGLLKDETYNPSVR